MSIRKESGEIMSDREEILRIYTDFYKSLQSNSAHIRKYNEIKKGRLEGNFLKNTNQVWK